MHFASHSAVKHCPIGWKLETVHLDWHCESSATELHELPFWGLHDVTRLALCLNPVAA